MTTTLYITNDTNMETTVMAYYLFKYFKTQVLAIEEKSTAIQQEINDNEEKNIDVKKLYIVQFVHPLPRKKIDSILEYGEYRFWPEPERMLRIYINNPNHIPPDHFTCQTRYVCASGDKYYRQLNTRDSTCYIVNKHTYKHTPLLENPFVY